MKLLPASYATRNLGRSPVRLLLSVGSAALVALLAMAGTGFATGMDRALRASGHPRVEHRVVPGHNHMSIVAHFNTAEETLGRQILAFLGIA